MATKRRTVADMGRVSFIDVLEIQETHKPCKLYFANDTNALYLSDQDNVLHSIDVDDLVTQGDGITVTGNQVAIRNAAGLTNLCIPCWNVANGQLQNTAVFSNAAGTMIGVGLANPLNRVSLPNLGKLAWKDAAGTGETAYIGSDANDDLILYTDSTARVTIDDSTGNVGVGTVAPGAKLDLRDGLFYLTDADVDHGMTVLYPTNTYGVCAPRSDTAGGLQIVGLSDTDATAMYLLAVMGSDNPTDATPAMQFVSSKKDGTSFQALGAAETAFQFYNYGTALMTILGNGNVGVGVVDPDTKLEVLYAGTQLKLSFDGTDNCTFAVDTDGKLTITPSGTEVEITKDSAPVVLDVETTTSGQATVGVGGYINTTTFGTLLGGAQMALQNKNNTNGNYSYISGLDSAANGVCALAFMNMDHTNHVGDIAFLTRISAGANAEKMRLTSAGNLGIGIATFDATAVGCVTIVNGTEPGSATADQVYIGSKDSAAGGATLMVYAEQAVATEAVVSDTTARVWWNGVEYKILLRAV